MSELSHPSHNLSPKAAHIAIMEGVSEGSHDQSKLGKLDSLFRESKDELIDVYQQLTGEPLAMRKLRDVGFASAAILTNPALKCAQGGNESLISPANTQLVREILSTAAIPSHQLEVNLAIGGSESPPSIRLPAYIDAAIKIAESFTPTKLEIPRVRIFNAHRISSAINGLDPVVAAKRAKQAADISQDYVETFYPHLVEHVQIEDLDLDTIDQGTFEHDASTLELLLESDEELMNPTEKMALDALKRLRRAATKHHTGDATNIDAIVCSYAASHGQSFRNYGFSDVRGVIKVGGRGEANFDTLQQYLASIHGRNGHIPVANHTASGEIQLVSLRSRAGEIPPYYPQVSESGQELTLDSSYDEIPKTIDEIRAMYIEKGLSSGSDFGYLSTEVKDRLPHFLWAHMICKARRTSEVAEKIVMLHIYGNR